MATRREERAQLDEAIGADRTALEAMGVELELVRAEIVALKLELGLLPVEGAEGLAAKFDALMGNPALNAAQRSWIEVHSAYQLQHVSAAGQHHVVSLFPR